MKRPLCYICMAFVATIFLFLKLSDVYSMDINDNAVINSMEGQRITFLGEVYHKEYKNQKLVLYLKKTEIKDQKNSQLIDLNENVNNEVIRYRQIMCYMNEGESEPKTGSTVLVKGEVSFFEEKRNPGEFDAAFYYSVQKIDFQLRNSTLLKVSDNYSLYRESLYGFRKYLEGIYDLIFNEKDASVMKAMVLGNKTQLDAQSKLLYQKSGIAHVFAISGLHITLLGMGLNRLLRKLKIPIWAAAGLSIVMMIMYGDMIGMSCSAYRAVFMFVLKMTASVMRRTYDMLTAVSITAVLLIIEQPLYIEYSGFLMSFGAIVAIGNLSEVFRLPEYKKVQLNLIKKADTNSISKKILIFKCKVINNISESLSAGISIFLIHFPIMLTSYYEFPIYSFILNLIIIPAMTIVMLLGVLCLIFGALSVNIAGISIGICISKILGILCHSLLTIFEILSNISLKLPFASWIIGCPQKWKIYVFYGIVLFLYFTYVYYEKMNKNRGLKIKLGIPLSMRYMLVVVAVLILTTHSYKGLKLTFVDVGQGDCIWIENDNGNHYVIDGGSSSEKKVGQYSIIPYLKYTGTSKIEILFLTHLDNDHISGILEILEGVNGIGTGIDIGRIVISNSVIKDEVYGNVVSICKEKGIPLLFADAGDEIKDGNLYFRVLHPDSKYITESRNAYSIVMQMLYTDRKNEKAFGALFTGDVEEDGEKTVAELIKNETYDSVWSRWKCNIYKAAHHGSKYSNTEELLKVIQPDISVISSGKNNRYGHPHNDTLDRLQSAGTGIYRTDECGAVMFNVYEGKIYVKKWK